jgi:hypothetical protein
MRYCSTCLYPAPCGRCEDSDNSSARIVVPDVRRVHCHACEQLVSSAGPWCDLYDPNNTYCEFAWDRIEWLHSPQDKT